MQTEILKPTPTSYKTIALHLKKNGVVALPTETVYGLAANAFSTPAILKIFKAKGRPKSDPLIVHISQKYLSKKNILLSLVRAQIIHASILKWENKNQIEKLIHAFWPGPLTLVLPKGKKIPKSITAGYPTVALRMPEHPYFQKVLSQVPFPLAAPSANRFGRISPTEAAHVYSELQGKIPYILDGGSCEIGVESTILKINETHATLLRPGKISAQSIALFIPVQTHIRPSYENENKAVLSPGTLENHYAPTKRMWFALGELPPLVEVQSLGFKVGVLNLSENPNLPHDFASKLTNIALTFHLQKSLPQIAKELFRALRALDEEPTIDAILVLSAPPPTEGEKNELQGLYEAINDRLSRASVNKPLKK